MKPRVMTEAVEILLLRSERLVPATSREEQNQAVEYTGADPERAMAVPSIPQDPEIGSIEHSKDRSKQRQAPE